MFWAFRTSQVKDQIFVFFSRLYPLWRFVHFVYILSYSNLVKLLQ